MMRITIEVPAAFNCNVGIRTEAEGVPEQAIRPMLQMAMDALVAEIDSLEDCPYHQRGAREE